MRRCIMCSGRRKFGCKLASVLLSIGSLLLCSWYVALSQFLTRASLRTLKLGLAWAFLPDKGALREGLILVGLARCIAMVSQLKLLEIQTTWLTRCPGPHLDRPSRRRQRILRHPRSHKLRAPNGPLRPTRPPLHQRNLARRRHSRHPLFHCRQIRRRLPRNPSRGCYHLSFHDSKVDQSEVV